MRPHFFKYNLSHKTKLETKIRKVRNTPHGVEHKQHVNAKNLPPSFILKTWQSPRICYFHQKRKYKIIGFFVVSCNISLQNVFESENAVVFSRFVSVFCQRHWLSPFGTIESNICYFYTLKTRKKTVFASIWKLHFLFTYSTCFGVVRATQQNIYALSNSLSVVTRREPREAR